ncbi:hypothetical protein HMPREF3216_00104 [Gardnerella vaginalis]|uniref:Uncharacterized protein n=1 Tax=Gardnerella vaginalis TaxID=2702 RepID=A0A133NT17_GARVA|nr:hypothetical protein HMPREF3216_00104 [Gardnerella vaginalis]
MLQSHYSKRVNHARMVFLCLFIFARVCLPKPQKREQTRAQ